MHIGYRCPAWQELPDLGLYLDQVMLVLEQSFAPLLPARGGVSSTIINNYVKQKLLPPTCKKKYGREHLAILVMLFLLKRAFSSAELAQLLAVLCEGRDTQTAYALFCAGLEHRLNGDTPAPQGVPPLVDAAIQTLAGRICFEQLLERSAGETGDRKAAKVSKKEKSHREKPAEEVFAEDKGAQTV